MTLTFNISSRQIAALLGFMSLLVAPSALQAIVVNSDLNNPNSQYSLKIVQVTYDAQATQDSTPNPTTVSTIPVSVTTITHTLNTVLPFYDNEVQAIGWNPASDATKFSVIKNGVHTEASVDANAYQAALSDSFTNTNLLHYSNKDSGAANTAYDYNIIFKYGLDVADYVVIGERDGNSSFTLQALDTTGSIIGNDVEFTQPYAWNTGYADTAFSTQPISISLIDLSAFFHDGATVETIYGFKVINNNGADIKLLAGSETSFIDANNENPNYPVPEPSTYALLLGLVTLGHVITRRRIK